MTTLEDFKGFEKVGKKGKKIPSHPKMLALTPLGRIVLKKSVLEGRIKLEKTPDWWEEFDVSDTIPGCFGEYLHENTCEKCKHRVWCEKQKILTRS